MRIRFLLALAVLVTAGDALTAQTSLRARTDAFPLAVVPWAALGFNGTRAVADDTDQLTCAVPARCFEYRLGNGPVLGVDLQLPLPTTFGVQLTASAGLPNQTRCALGNCLSIDRVTMLRGSALLLIRLKARAPIFFGLGAAASRMNPGPVQGIQDTITVTEVGAAGLIAYDVSMGSNVGARVSWAHYLLKPSSEGFPNTFQVESFAYDWLLSIGARIKIGS
jgi:hypothetical protein